MAFMLQLRMLMWKNFLLRKRQKFRLLVELVWPLFLFLILMWVRRRGLRVNIQECHFTPKAMPSVGQLPFLQSFLCSFNNTCYKSDEDAQIDASNLRSARLPQLVDEYAQLFESRMDQEVAINVVKDLDRLSNLVQNVASRRVQPTGTTSNC
ncbi:retinal-specific phospholipid-transporting ATPase ABCA4-like [Macrosteles quadrilineatus]|uniref:retinal-specific phospholipid-transporting ATPase ABCA4-like n=1 Tax=Macrosteles quadrilineatus TaxID=74068 RepID=UPI0023E0F19D|nr:retinal-specific phospholipid-transporting ATPase ABCA4-like [Macrosteles quadrilineatus]